MRNGLIPIALLTLGVQISKSSFSLKQVAIYWVTLLRLIGGPVVAYFLIKVMDISGVMAQVLLISSAVPSAANKALIGVEFNNEPDFAARVVLVTTLFSIIILTGVIFLSGMIF